MIKRIIYIWCIIVVLSVIAKSVQSEEHPMFPPGVLKTQQVPIFCGPGPLVFSYASSLFKQKAIAWSDVKTSGEPGAESFAWLSFWYSSELENGSVFLTIRETSETCMMGYGMDWIFDTELLLDIVNDSFANGSKLPDEAE